MTAPNAPMSAEQIVALDRLTHLIASELARIDGFDPDDQHGGLYDLRWQGGSMHYLPKAERIAHAAVAAMAEREAALVARVAELEESFARAGLNAREAQTKAHEATIALGTAKAEIARLELVQVPALVKEVEALRAALRNLVGAVSSINSGKVHELTVSGERVYWQREEWVRWMLDEILPSARAAIDAALLACKGQDHER